MVTEGEERRKVAEDLDEEKIDENLSKVGRKQPSMSGSTKNPNQDQPKRFTPTFGKIKKKKKILTAGKTNSYVSIRL